MSIVYVNVSTALLFIPLFTANALIVVSTLCPASPVISIGAVYCLVVPDGTPSVNAGSLPSVV